MSLKFKTGFLLAIMILSITGCAASRSAPIAFSGNISDESKRLELFINKNKSELSTMKSFAKLRLDDNGTVTSFDAAIAIANEGKVRVDLYDELAGNLGGLGSDGKTIWMRGFGKKRISTLSADRLDKIIKAKLAIGELAAILQGVPPLGEGVGLHDRGAGISYFISTDHRLAIDTKDALPIRCAILDPTKGREEAIIEFGGWQKLGSAILPRSISLNLMHKGIKISIEYIDPKFSQTTDESIFAVPGKLQ